MHLGKSSGKSLSRLSPAVGQHLSSIAWFHWLMFLHQLATRRSPPLLLPTPMTTLPPGSRLLSKPLPPRKSVSSAMTTLKKNDRTPRAVSSSWSLVPANQYKHRLSSDNHHLGLQLRAWTCFVVLFSCVAGPNHVRYSTHRGLTRGRSAGGGILYILHTYSHKSSNA